MFVEVAGAGPGLATAPQCALRKCAHFSRWPCHAVHVVPHLGLVSLAMGLAGSLVGWLLHYVRLVRTAMRTVLPPLEAGRGSRIAGPPAYSPLSARPPLSPGPRSLPAPVLPPPSRSFPPYPALALGRPGAHGRHNYRLVRSWLVHCVDCVLLLCSHADSAPGVVQPPAELPPAPRTAPGTVRDYRHGWWWVGCDVRVALQDSVMGHVGTWNLLHKGPYWALRATAAHLRCCRSRSETRDPMTRGEVRLASWGPCPEGGVGRPAPARQPSHRRPSQELS